MRPSEGIEGQGGMVCELCVSSEKAILLHEEALRCPSIDLTARQLCDLELLLSGGFSPLRGFLYRKDYDSVLDQLRLADGTVWPMPIVLDVSEERARSLTRAERVVLRDAEGFPLAILTINEIWEADKEREAARVFGTTDSAHPGVRTLYREVASHYIGGDLEGFQLPRHYDFVDLRHTPTQLRELFGRQGWEQIIGFQTRNPMHRAHVEMTLQAAEEVGGHLLVHPVVGMTKRGDINHYSRVHCYRHVLNRYPPGMAVLSLLPLAMRMAGPREALWHALIRQNYGCTHFIVGRDHAGLGNDGTSQIFYRPYEAQALVEKFQDEIGIRMVPFQEMVYVPARRRYYPIDEVPEGTETVTISGTELRQRLVEGREVPEWFTYPEVVAELSKIHRPKAGQGFTIFFTGLPAAGKSTIANVLLVKFLEMGERPVTLLDGDIVRKNLSSELGFSKEHRDLNVRRIGFVANEITKNGGIAICAPIAPYEAVRRENRELITHHGGYIEVYVSTPLEVCDRRDRKGLYAKARAGLLKGLSGVDDPYETPTKPELRIDTTNQTPEDCAEEILRYLAAAGYIERTP